MADEEYLLWKAMAIFSLACALGAGAFAVWLEGGAVAGPDVHPADKRYLQPLAKSERAPVRFTPAFLHGSRIGVGRGDAEIINPYIRVAELSNGLGDEINVQAARQAGGDAVLVVAKLLLAANPDVVRAVLFDYEHMPSFVPDITMARVIDTESSRQRVNIVGVVRFLFLEFPIDTTFDVVLQPDGAMNIDSVAGNLTMHGIVRVEHDGQHTRVDYVAQITPAFWLPPLIGDYLIGRQIKRQFEGIAAEIHRRARNMRNVA